MKEMNSRRIPVHIITGFLGTGKTTVLNQFITCFPDTKFGIIENEFGDISIDQELLFYVKEDVFGLSGGCLCCSLNGELELLLRDLLGMHGRFDHLIVETTGMADPGPVASSFLFSEEIRCAFELKGTIAVVDAKKCTGTGQYAG